MKIAVRYFSLHGNTKTIAEEIADELGVEAISINDEPELKERVDVLFFRVRQPNILSLTN